MNNVFYTPRMQNRAFSIKLPVNGRLLFFWIAPAGPIPATSPFPLPGTNKTLILPESAVIPRVFSVILKNETAKTS